ncbi:type II secretion system F family protein [Nocardioides bruguierae]|uniref:Type II secretion system F family protein n=1 Tax=Nocardioides bruguierae TaxID=2945102 RepID=A0A9X2D8D9_9ACTN|nr:type II secretion system F family protein [Nocardioides bruguierae]MCM0621268.1 type II secretion system F family protein [Nocardioides bruguierae]
MSLVLGVLGGALAGAGLLLAGWLVAQPSTSGPVALARLDARRRRGQRHAGLTADRRHADESPRMRRLGSGLLDAVEARGVRLPGRLAPALGMTGMSMEMFLARTVVGGLLGLLLPVVVLGPGSLTGLLPVTAPLWLVLVGGLVGLVVPYLDVLQKAGERRRDFRHMVSAFLDLVAMNLAGGRGVPEALSSATSVSDGWAMVRIRDTLEAARLQGSTPWAALGQLGVEVDVDELRDLAAALALVAEDGAKVRDSLSARAASMRRRELAEAEGRAAARSQSMLVAQVLIALGFLLFLMFPAVIRIL